MTTFTNIFWGLYTKAIARKTIIYQVGVICGVILLSLLVAIKSSQNINLLLVGAVVGIAGLVILLRWPALGLIITIVGGFFLQISGPSNINITVVGILGLVCLWIAKMFIIDQKFQLVSSRTFTPIIVFIILSFLSFGIGLLPLVPFATPAPIDAQIGGLAIFLLSAGAFLFVANTISLNWLQRLTWAFIAVGASYFVARIIVAQGIHLGRPFDPGATTGSMFHTWFVALTFSQIWFNKKLHPAVRGLLGLLLAITFYVTYGFDYDWKSGWLPPLIAIMAMIGFRYWRIMLLLSPLGLIMGITAAIVIMGTDTYSWGTRVEAWQIVINIAKASPIFGLGFANYYWYSRFFPIRGWFVPFNSHSQYVDIIAQTGIVGLISFLWIFFEVARTGFNLRERAPEGFPRAYTYGVLGGVIGTLVAASLVDWVLPFAYNIGLAGFRASILPWIFMGGLVCIEQLVHHQTESQTLGENMLKNTNAQRSNG